MDKIEIINFTKKYIKAIQEKYKVEKVILFGSFAKNTNHIDSDIDLAIVLTGVTDIFETQIDLLNLRDDDDLLIEPHLFLLSDFNENNPTVVEIKKNGIELFNKAA